MVTIHYLQTSGLNSTQQKDFRSALERLRADLSTPPCHCELNFVPAEPTWQLEGCLAAFMDAGAWAASLCFALQKHSLSIDNPIRLVIHCPADHAIAASAKLHMPSAEWGISWPGMLALIYPPPEDAAAYPFIVWHETLHVLGAGDCYDPETRQPACDLENCVMRYEPTSSFRPMWPYLCEKNLRLLPNASQQPQVD